MKHYKPYLITYIAFLVCLFTAPHIYSHFHFEAVPLVEMYQSEKNKWEESHSFEERFMNYAEWIEHEEKRSENFWQECSYQITESFDPWFERPDVTEKGRD